MRTIKPVVPPPPPSQGSGLGEKIVSTIINGFVNLYEWTIAPLSDRVRRGIDRWFEDIEGNVVRQFGPVLNMIADNPDLPKELRDIADDARNPTDAIALPAVIGICLIALPFLLSPAFAPVGRVIEQSVEKSVKSQLPDTATLVMSYYRNAITENQYFDTMAKHGYSREYAQDYLDVTRLRIDDNSLLASYVRGETNLSVVRSELTRRGYTSPDVDRILELTERIPGPDDLVRMAVREAWRDDVASKWGYDADFPSSFASWMEKQGYNADWSKRYWRAHWNLPSISLARELVYRGAITEAEFKELLRISDIPQTWRDKIASVIHLPYTRVDTRRMYNFGILDEQEVNSSYLAQGYNAERAANLTAFTVANSLEDERDLSRSDIVSGYKIGTISERELSDFLSAMGYNSKAVQFYVSRANYQLQQEIVDEQVKIIHELYTYSEIDETQARTKLTDLALTASEIGRKVDLWKLERERKIKRPSRSTLDNMFREDIITSDEYQAGLESIGYQTRYIDWYYQTTLAKKETTAKDEERKAREEQQLITKRKHRNQYQTSKAELDVDIAEIQTAITETQGGLQARKLRFLADMRLAEQAIDIEQVNYRYRESLLIEQGKITNINVEIAESRHEQALTRNEVLALEGIILETIEPLDEYTASKRIEKEKSIIKGNEIAIGETMVTIALLKLVPVTIPLPASKEDVSSRMIELTQSIQELPKAADELRSQQAALRLLHDLFTFPVSVEDVQMTIAAHNLEVAEIRLAIQRGREKIIELQFSTKEGELIEFEQEITKLIHEQVTAFNRLDAEIAAAKIEIEGIEVGINQIRTNWVNEIARLEAVDDVEALEGTYLEDVEIFRSKLAEYRNRLYQLKEVKATLTVEYRVEIEGVGENGG
jgi:hypothetical protein